MLSGLELSCCDEVIAAMDDDDDDEVTEADEETVPAELDCCDEVTAATVDEEDGRAVTELETDEEASGVADDDDDDEDVAGTTEPATNVRPMEEQVGSELGTLVVTSTNLKLVVFATWFTASTFSNHPYCQLTLRQVASFKEEKDTVDTVGSSANFSVVLVPFNAV